MRALLAFIAAYMLAACSSHAVPPPVTAAPAAARRASPPPQPPSPPAPSIDVPLSDPAEYAIDHISRDAGERIFTTTGIGDPYRTGIPYPIFVALLHAFPSALGSDTQALADRFGFIARPADPASSDADVRAGLPVGMHLTTDPLTGVAFVVTSCALCHAAEVDHTVVFGLANRRAKIHAYDRAFAEITTMHGFSVDHLAHLAGKAAVELNATWPDQVSDVMVTATVDALVKRAGERAELHARTAADPPGRVATIDSFVLPLRHLTGRYVEYSPAVGWAKIPDVIGFGHRTTLSWDSSGEGPMDVLAVEADIAAGVRVAWLERHPFQGPSLAAYLRDPAPRPAFPGHIDRAKADRGRRLFAGNCAPCHGSYDNGRVDYEERVIPVVDLGTDPTRTLAATDSFIAAANDPALTRGYTKFRRTGGYVPPVLVAVWARAPYGHVGQWPNLAFMAMPPAKRPHRYSVAYDAPYDLTAVGLSTTTEPRGSGDYAYDADHPGFAVDGHPFLSDLKAQAGDVIEYLKTL